MYAHEIRAVIDQLAREANGSLSKHNKLIQQTQAQVMDLSLKQPELYQKISGILLQEGPDLAEMEKVNALVRQFKNEMGTFEERQRWLQEKIEELQAEQHTLDEKIVLHEQGRNEKISQNEPLKQLFEETSQAHAAAKDAIFLNDELKAEVAEKLQEYTQDPRFIYLLKSRFGEPEYKAWAMVRNLDAWLARQVNFSRNRENQKLLLALLDESGLRRDKAEQRHVLLTQQYREQVAKIESTDGLNALYQKRQEITTSLTEHQQQYDLAFQNFTQSQTDRGRLFRETSEKIGKIMEAMSVDQLTSLIQKTASKEDDRLLQQILKRERDLEQQQAYLYTLQEEKKHKNWLTSQVVHLKTQFQNHFWGSDHAEYTLSKEDFLALLDRLKEGRLKANDLLEELVPVVSKDEPSYFTLGGSSPGYPDFSSSTSLSGKFRNPSNSSRSLSSESSA